jgi:hypothetical protein
MFDVLLVRSYFSVFCEILWQPIQPVYLFQSESRQHELFWRWILRRLVQVVNGELFIVQHYFMYYTVTDCIVLYTGVG